MVKLRVSVLPLVSVNDVPFHRTAHWFDAVSLGRCSIEFDVLPRIDPPKAIALYKQAGGKGAWPGNSQGLAADLLRLVPASGRDSRHGALVIVGGNEFLPHTWHLPNTGGQRIQRYSVIPAAATLGVVAHELGHLLFDWPDLNWQPQYAHECLMARGAAGQRGADPSAPCAPLLVDVGWRDVLPLTRELTLADMRPDCVGHIDWNGRQVFAEARQDHLLACIAGRYPQMIARLPLAAADRRRSLLGLLAPSLRLAQPSGH